jgi:prephenate dehydrogenase
MIMEKKKLSIVGTGLIGCSFALGVRNKFGEICGFDKDSESLDYAVQSGIIDSSSSLENISRDSDIIIVSVPVDVALTLIPKILFLAKNDAVVIDVGSTKVPICNALKDHPRRVCFVAAHPMAGSEASGSRNATENLFQGKKVIICQPEQSSTVALEQAQYIFKTLGMSIELMDAEVHDSLVSMVSHLPQVVSYCLTKAVDDASCNDLWSSIAATGFDSSTRLSKSSADIWIPILLQNKGNINNHLHLFIDEIKNLINLLDNDNADGLTQFILQSQIVREKFEKNVNNNCQTNGNKSITRNKANKFVATGIE